MEFYKINTPPLPPGQHWEKQEEDLFVGSRSLCIMIITDQTNGISIPIASSSDTEGKGRGRGLII